jgi:YaiO family outer membrane protein
MSFTIRWVAALAALIAPGSASAKPCPTIALGQTEVRLDVNASDTRSGNAWRDAAVSLGSTNPNCSRTLTARYEHLERFGTSNDTLSLEGVFRRDDESYVRVSTLVGPDALFVPEFALETEYGRPFKFASGPLSAVVGAMSARYAAYAPSELVSITAHGEFYPRDVNLWLTLRVSQTWSDRSSLPATLLARIDRPLTDTTRLFALHVTGYEANQSDIEKVSATALGLATRIRPDVSLILSGAYEDRSEGQSRRTASLSIARTF